MRPSFPGIPAGAAQPARYLGEILRSCPARIYDFMNTAAVVVSGSRFNPCGHVLLNAGGCGGWYFHVIEVRGFPRGMPAAGYRRFLDENGKRERTRVRVPLPQPARAMAKLEEIMSRKCTWMVLPHNCAGFVEEILQAGGSDAHLWSNCPTLESFR